MATVYATMGRAGAHSAASQMPIYQRDARSETIASSGTTAQGSLVAGQNETVAIFCDTAIYVTLGADPTATATNGRFIPGGRATDIKCGAGDKLAVIDA